ncbi:MAG: RagB/SusD family nutrient uptake outer membrane protein [Prolixibacteraceae bacterium]|nr:RagB/SusD family nutrient uptake outer membrane protein [Prolixibacteraceae bacterium]
MKNTIKYLFFIGILYLFTACKDELKFGNNFLSKPPLSTAVNKDTVFSNITYAERFLWGAYSSLPFGQSAQDGNNFGSGSSFYLDCLTDMINTDLVPAVPYYVNLYDAYVENSYIGKYRWNFGGWPGIRKANIFIANIGRVPNVDATYRKQLIAEARMIMAVHYTELYRNYGGMIWINHELAVTETGPFPRLTSVATMDSIVSLIDKAVPDLPWIITDQVNWDGRFTKAAAMALKARVLLFGASPLFNSAAPYMDGEAAQKKLVWNGSYDPNLWKRAADAAAALISRVESEGGYRIVKTGNPRKDFQNGYYTRGTGETLISTRTVFLYPDDDRTLGPIKWSGTGTYTQEYVDMFPMANGLPITDPASGFNPNDPYVNRDPRLYETVLVNGDYYQGRTAELFLGGRERLSKKDLPALTGYGPRKFVLERNTATNLGSIVQWPYLRLPEVYLSCAEALNEVNNGPTAEAYRCVNLVRNRVNLSNLPAGLSKDKFREAVLNERACEFGFERVRWYDIIRWKKEDVFKKQLHGMDITKSGSTLSYATFPLTPIRYWSTNWSPKWYLSAFPANEILKGTGLIQNPGWEIN